MALHRFRSVLYVSTCGYLSLPYVVFFLGWMRQPYAALFTALLLVGVVFAIRRNATGHPEDLPAGTGTVPYRELALVLLPVAVVAAIAGAGGWGFQDTDWLKHNAILRDLITHPWPVVYDVDGARVMLTYYVAYQLPAAAVGKVLGWEAANHFLFVYTLFGLSVAACWVWLLTRSKAWWFVVGFLAFSGMDVVGTAISTVHLAPTMAQAARDLLEKITTFDHLEWWTGWGFAQFSSTAALIVWVPNQATAGWLLTALALNDANARHLQVTAFLYVALSVLWAPFVTIGLIPIMAMLLLRQWKADAFSIATLRQAVSWPNAAGMLVGLLSAFYLAGRFESYTLPIDSAEIYREHITLTFLRIPELFVVRYALFVGLEFLALHVLLYLYLAVHKELLSGTLTTLFRASTVILLALPILNWGWNNEPAMRTSIPALFVTMLVTIQVLNSIPRTAVARLARTGILVLLAVGSLNVASELGRHVAGIYRQGSLVAVPRQDEVETLFQLQDRRYREYYNFVAQYVGSADSRFVDVLAKPPEH